MDPRLRFILVPELTKQAAFYITFKFTIDLSLLINSSRFFCCLSAFNFNSIFMNLFYGSLGTKERFVPTSPRTLCIQLV